MRRKRNWFIKRLVLGFAAAALVVPSAALAAVDEGGAGQPNSTGEIANSAYVPFATDFPKSEVTSNVQAGSGKVSIEDVRLNPRSTTSEQVVKAGDYGMPRAMPNDYALQRGDMIEVARTHARNVVSADIENVRLNPRTVSTPEVVSAGFDWGDAGIGAGIILGLVLVGGAAFIATRQVGKPQTA
jgi:hypothetical protein